MKIFIFCCKFFKENEIEKLPSEKKEEYFRKMNEIGSKGILAEKEGLFSLGISPNKIREANPNNVFSKKKSPEKTLMDQKLKEMRMSQSLAK